MAQAANWQRGLYDAYVANTTDAATRYADEGGPRAPNLMSLDEFSALPAETQFQQAQAYAGYTAALNQVGNLSLDPSSPEVQQFVQQFGQSPGFAPVQLSGQDLTGYEMGYGDPRMYDMGADQFMRDPGRILRLPDGRYIVESANRSADAIVGAQSRDSDSGLGDGTRWAIAGIGTVLGAGLLGNALMAGEGLAGNAATGYGLGGSAGEAGAAGGMGGMGGAAGGAGGLATDIAPGYLAESVAPTVTETMAGSPFGGSWYSGMADYAMRNQLNTARAGLGVASALGGGSGGSGGSPSGSQAPTGMNAPTFNPLGAAGQYQPNQNAYQPLQFDPVPFMGDSTMYQNYSPYGNQGYSTMPGQSPTMQSQQSGGMGYNQASPVTLPWMQGNQSSNPSFGKPYMQGPSSGSQLPPGMGYIGSGPGGGFSPVQPPNGWGQPSQGASGGLLGNQGQSAAMQAYGSSPVAGMDNRTFQMMARYLPNSGTGVDPVASPGTVRNRYGGDWTKMVPQNLQGKFQQFQDAMGGMTDYNQFRAYQGRPEINYGGQGTRWNPWS